MSGLATWECDVCPGSIILPVDKTPTKWVRCHALVYKANEADATERRLTVNLHICDECVKRLNTLKDGDVIKLDISGVKKPKRKKRKASAKVQVNLDAKGLAVAPKPTIKKVSKEKERDVGMAEFLGRDN